MMNNRVAEVTVGFFMLLGILALLVLALKVSGLSTSISGTHMYQVSASFDNIGDLKVRAPVTIAGVRVGQVQSIALDPVSFKAKVVMALDPKENKIPSDTQASIYTAGLLGSNYIGLTPGFEDTNLHAGSLITQTHSAIVLEDLIGQFMYKISNDGDKKKSDDNKN
jgi:phospholipid/cholesterol/gamma-HCH transport system substrate-binding protein